MARYRMDDGTVLDTKNATQEWEEDTFWDGSNHISKATGSQWRHQTLYRSKKGRYYTETISAYEGSVDRAEWISNEEAVRWLLTNEHEIPEELSHLVESIVE